MKKLIATILVLAMVFTMALSVSAAPGATLSNYTEGTYTATHPMTGMTVYEFIFTKTNLAGGTLVINSADMYNGTYSYSVDDFNGIVTVEAADGTDVSSIIVFSLDAGGNFIVSFPRDFGASYVLASGNSAPAAVDLVIGANAIDVTVENYWCDGTVTHFTAPEAGTYVFTPAAGENNAEVGYYGDPDDWDDDVWNIFENGSYEFTLAAGETIELVVYTTEYMTLTEDTIDFTIAKKAPGASSPENGDSTALYVAVAAVALTAIFGCAIVSKKRIAE